MGSVLDGLPSVSASASFGDGGADGHCHILAHTLNVHQAHIGIVELQCYGPKHCSRTRAVTVRLIDFGVY